MIRWYWVTIETSRLLNGFSSEKFKSFDIFNKFKNILSIKYIARIYVKHILFIYCRPGLEFEGGGQLELILMREHKL